MQIAGQWASAAKAWDTLGQPYEAARARAEGNDEFALRAALATFGLAGLVYGLIESRRMAELFADRLIDAIARDPKQRALYLYPTKALAQDQARKLSELHLAALRQRRGAVHRQRDFYLAGGDAGEYEESSRIGSSSDAGRAQLEVCIGQSEW